MITAEEFKNLTEEEQLDNIETMTSEERMQLVRELFPNFKMKVTKMGWDNEGRNKYKVTVSNGNTPFIMKTITAIAGIMTSMVYSVKNGTYICLNMLFITSSAST